MYIQNRHFCVDISNALLLDISALLLRPFCHREGPFSVSSELMSFLSHPLKEGPF